MLLYGPSSSSLSDSDPCGSMSASKIGILFISQFVYKYLSKTFDSATPALPSSTPSSFYLPLPLS